MRKSSLVAVAAVPLVWTIAETDRITRAAEALAFDPARLDQAEARLFDIRALARKHRVEPDALAALGARMRDQLAAIEAGSERIGEFERQLVAAREAFAAAAETLSRKRHEAAAKLAKAGTIALGTVGFGAPIFGVFANDNNPRFRDGKPWPESIAGANRDAAGRALGTEAAYAMMNARTIWDNGGLIGYCTDTNYEPLAGLEHELKSYSIVFSMQDIFKLMGPNTAAYIGMGDQLGTLEAGKLADIVLLDGNPMEGIHNMLKTRVVVKGGKVVVDKR